MTRPVRIVLLLVLLVAVAVPAVLVAGAWWWWGQRQVGADPVEKWCGDQLRRIAGDLLEPAFDFKALHLQLPATVTLKDVSLVADDVTIIAASEMRLEFREMPKRGQPLVIKAATFVKPEVRLVEAPEAGLVGFRHFMKSTTGTTHADGSSSRPSDFLAIRHITISDGMLEWAPAGHDNPLRFEQMDLDLDTEPDGSRPGWYDFNAKIERPPVIDLTWVGGISIDTAELALDETELKVDLSEDKYASLTPSIQDILRRYAVVGDLDLKLTGTIPLADAQSTDLTIDAELRNSSAAIGEYQFPIDSASAKATFHEMTLAYDPVTINAFGGHIGSSGSVGFSGDRAFALSVDATDVLIQDMLRPEPGGDPPKLSGAVGLEMTAQGASAPENASLSGSGSVTIANGTLIEIPVIGALAKTLKILGKYQGGQDRGEAEFTLASDRASITRATIESPLAAARGTGDIHYDSRLDLVVNAGVLEKAESLLGGIGDLISGLTDKLLPYKVTGTWSEPEVKPAPLGIGLGKEG